MNKETSADDAHVESGSDHPKRVRPVQGSSARSAPISKRQEQSRSDQEQEGMQNPAGDTREVSREPVDHASDQTEK
jgi:hypothetical protein